MMLPHTHKQWEFTVAGQAHRLELVRTELTDHHVLRLDGNVLFDGEVMLEFGKEIDFEVEGHPAAFHIDVPGRLSYEYSLTVDAPEISEALPLS